MNRRHLALTLLGVAFVMATQTLRVVRGDRALVRLVESR